MKRGFIVGKFFPFHHGHKYLIEEGLKVCDHLHVAVCHSKVTEDRIPAKVRQAWIQAAFHEYGPAKFTTSIIYQDRLDLDDNDSKGWADATINHLGYAPDLVITSEQYGYDWAHAISEISDTPTRNHVVDMHRDTFPISGTQVRQNPWSHSGYLDPIVNDWFNSREGKKAFVRRVCVIGAESTGKTTLCKDLAFEYGTVWAPEYGRIFTELLPNPTGYKWKVEDFIYIAEMQNLLEDEYAAEADNGVVFYDTNSFVTEVFCHQYLGVWSHRLHELTNRRYDLYVLTDPDTPFEQDHTGLRDASARAEMHGTYLARLNSGHTPYIKVTGNRFTRVTQADEAIWLKGWRNGYHAS